MPQDGAVEVPARDMFAGIEDDIEFEVGTGEDGATQPVQASVTFRRLVKKAPGLDGEVGLGRAGDDATEVDTPPSNVEREGSAVHRASVLEGADDDEVGDGEGQGYWDEEDEIEAYYAEKQAKRKNVYDGEDEDALSHSSSSDDDDEHVEDAALIAGDGGMRGDMDAETQRLLREVAAKDRLGKGQKVQIKALSGIADKLRKRKEQMAEKAAAMRAPEAPSFDDILGLTGMKVPRDESRDRDIDGNDDGMGDGKGDGKGDEVGAADPAPAEGQADPLPQAPAELDVNAGVGEGNACPEQVTPVKQLRNTGIASFFRKAAVSKGMDQTGGGVVGAAGGEKDEEEEEEEGLEIVDGDEDGNRIVELPRMTPTKPSPLAFNLEYNKSAEMDDFEEEQPLIDDGIGTDEDSDSESDHSWAIHENDDGEGEGDVKSIEREQGDVPGDDMSPNRDDNRVEEDGVGVENAKQGAEGGAQMVTFVRMRDNMKKLTDAENAKDATAASLQAKKLSNRFLDEEAELSEDEDMGIAVSDDEEEGNAQDVDQNGELKDLIDASGKNLDKNNDATEELHIKWARQQEAQQLKNILRGLENGFGRRNKGPLDDEDGEMSGRRRRARRDDDDDDDFNLESAWPSLFGLGGHIGGTKKDDDGEECEDEIILRKAVQRKLVESQSERLFGTDGSFTIPLDEDSQHVLELFGKSDDKSGNCPAGDAIGGSEGRQARNPSLKRLRSKDRTMSMSTHSSEPLSFIGRQSKIQRQTSKSNMGINMNKTFVFGRKADISASDSQMGSDERENTKPQGTQNSQSVCGAIDFSGLKSELTTKEERSQNLLANLPRWNKPSNLKKQASGAVFDAVCNRMHKKPSN